MATDYTQQIVTLLDSLLKQYQPGGTYQKAQETGLGQQKEKFMGETAQRLTSAGLASTTAGAGAGERWEREVGAPSRLNISDIMSSRLAGLATAKAGYLQTAATQQIAVTEAEKDRQFRLLLQSNEEFNRIAAENRVSNAAEWERVFGAGSVSKIASGGSIPTTGSGGGGNMFGGEGGGGINYITSLGGGGGGGEYFTDPTLGAEGFYYGEGYSTPGGSYAGSGGGYHEKGYTGGGGELGGLKTAAGYGGESIGKSKGPITQGAPTGTTPGEFYLMQDGKRVGIQIGKTKAMFPKTLGF